MKTIPLSLEILPNVIEEWSWKTYNVNMTASQKVHLLRCASSFVTAAYFCVRLIPRDLRALHLDLFSLPPDFNFLQ